jgi:WD40 repeat protein
MKRPVKKFILSILGSAFGIVVLSFCYLAFFGSKTIDTGIAKLSQTFTDHSSSVWSVRFSPDGNVIASGSVDSTVIIRDRRSGAIIHILKQPQGVTAIDFSPDGKFLISASYDSKVRLWNVADGSLLKVFEGHKGTIWTVAFSPNGEKIASAGEDATIRIWDIVSGHILQTLTGHSRNIWSVKFSPDGKILASGSFDSQVKLWDIETGNLIRTIAGHTEAVVDLAFSHTKKWLATVSDDKTIKIWNFETGNLIRTLKVAEHVQAVAFSPDDKRLMTAGRDKAMLGELIQNFTGDSEYFKGVSARLWDIESGTILQTFCIHKNDVNDVAYSNDGLWITTASVDHTVELWEVMK